MYRHRKAVLSGLAAALVAAAGASSHAQERYGLGSPATEEELARFVSPLPDGRGLPRGSGSVAAGKKVYDAQCMACHGMNLEGGQGDRLIGGRGSLAGNDPSKPPIKTVESYWPHATTLFDYIKRAMPLTAPGTMSDDDVYAVTAYILARAKILADDANLDARSLAAVRMPNRDGFIPDPRPEKFPPADRAPPPSAEAPASSGR
jgi:cytochrome c